MLIEKIGTAAMLEQTAEECVELAQACLKVARKIRNENPTPKTMEVVKDNFTEELADVLICLDELTIGGYLDGEGLKKWTDYKRNRITERLGGCYGEKKPREQTRPTEETEK